MKKITVLTAFFEVSTMFGTISRMVLIFVEPGAFLVLTFGKLGAYLSGTGANQSFGWVPRILVGA